VLVDPWLLSEKPIHQFPDNTNYQTHEPRPSQKTLEKSDQLLTLIVLPTCVLLNHGLVSVWCEIAPLATPETGKRQLLPSYSPPASHLADAT
jgi:hypothetical protein